MSKLIFIYGAMGCSKSANALMTRFQYIERNKKVLLIKPAIDTRDDTNKIIIKSRVGIEAPAIAISEENQITKLYFKKHPDVIICDEAQFLSETQVEELKNISSSIDVYCYGLRTDFQTKLFPGSKRLFELADQISEIEMVCDCGKKASVNARFDKDGNIIKEGNQVEIGGNDKYHAICWDCYIKEINN